MPDPRASELDHETKERAGTETFDRVEVGRGYPAHIMAIDGIWRRSCTLGNVSDSGARLTVDTAMEGSSLKEFFLLLSSTGLAYLRCQLGWVNADQLGIQLLKQEQEKKRRALR